MYGFWKVCPECCGEGTVEQETYHRDMISAKDVTCDNCGGSGEVLIEDEDDLIEEDDTIMDVSMLKNWRK